MRQGGEEIGIRVSDLMVQEQIKDMEVFQEDGHFNQQRYKDLLARNRMTPAVFEESIKSDLRSERISNDLADFALIPDNEVDRWLAYNEEEVKLAYVQLKAANFKDKVEIQDEELATWFASKKENYRSEPKIRLKYLSFKTNDDMEQVKPSEEEIQALYKERKKAINSRSNAMPAIFFSKPTKETVRLSGLRKRNRPKRSFSLPARKGATSANWPRNTQKAPQKKKVEIWVSSLTVAWFRPLIRLFSLFSPVKSATS